MLISGSDLYAGSSSGRIVSPGREGVRPSAPESTAPVPPVGAGDGARPEGKPPVPSIDGASVVAIQGEADDGEVEQKPEAAGDGAKKEPEAAAEEEERGPDDLSEEDERVVVELVKRDQEVKRHEQAHAAVGGQYAGAPSYEYQQGPDGKRYAVGGEVSIDTSTVKGDPQATIRKMETVIRAATAPADPSAQDRRVASAAAQARAQALAELAVKRQAEAQEQAGGNGNDDSPALPGSAVAAQAASAYGPKGSSGGSFRAVA